VCVRDAVKLRPHKASEETSMSYTYQYPRAALTVDLAVVASVRERASEAQVLLIRRDKPPCEGAWALPGGFVELDETVEQAACRELREETSVQLEHAEQLYVYDSIDRDPRERIISVLHVAYVERDAHEPRAADDAREVAWHPLARLPELAFDHAQMLTRVRDHAIAHGKYRAE
jgi:8-oxo-dGTP diphosphatase